MRGFVAVTDPGWCAHLSRTSGPKDANFWRPSARAFRLDTGTPFFFKLKAPHHAIAGFGDFAGFSILPDWLAWDTFGEANGVASLAELRKRLSTVSPPASLATILLLNPFEYSITVLGAPGGQVVTPPCAAERAHLC